MNYIKQLQSTIAENTIINDKMEEEMIDFSLHLTSSKFHVDTTIQVSDVLRFITRLYDIKTGI